MEYQEKVICGNCKTTHYRELEVIESSGRYSEFDQPLSLIIVKKFECKKCKENNNYTVDIVEKNKRVKNAI